MTSPAAISATRRHAVVRVAKERDASPARILAVTSAYWLHSAHSAVWLLSQFLVCPRYPFH